MKVYSTNNRITNRGLLYSGKNLLLWVSVKYKSVKFRKLPTCRVVTVLMNARVCHGAIPP